MGAPRDEEVLETDLFQSISKFEELCSELLDDSYRADYLDPDAHEGFTPELSRRIAVELKGMVELVEFKERNNGGGWPGDVAAPDAAPERFAWMLQYQAKPGSGAKERGRRSGGSIGKTSQVVGAGGGGGGSEQQSPWLSELYADDGDLYTSGTDGGGRDASDETAARMGSVDETKGSERPASSSSSSAASTAADGTVELTVLDSSGGVGEGKTDGNASGALSQVAETINPMIGNKV